MLAHLIELRKRAIYSTLVFCVLFVLFFCSANSLFQLLTAPLTRALPNAHGLIATKVAAPIMTPVKLAMQVALLGTTPFVLAQIWLFISPGLYILERRILAQTILFSTALFAFGLGFCFFVVLPFMFHFFSANVPLGVKYQPDISDAVNFIASMLLWFGLIFQIPLLCQLSVRLGWLSIDALQRARPYVIVAAFTLGMLLTPPDVLSQILLAVPMCLLYELGILLAKRYR